jgi:hypothetical protein
LILADPARLKGIFHALDDGTKDVALVGSVDHCEAVDDATAAAEHHLLIEGFSAALSGQHKPGSTEPPVSDLKTSV